MTSSSDVAATAVVVIVAVAAQRERRRNRAALSQPQGVHTLHPERRNYAANEGTFPRRLSSVTSHGRDAKTAMGPMTRAALTCRLIETRHHRLYTDKHNPYFHEPRVSPRAGQPSLYELSSGHGMTWAIFSLRQDKNQLPREREREKDYSKRNRQIADNLARDSFVRACTCSLFCQFALSLTLYSDTTGSVNPSRCHDLS